MGRLVPTIGLMLGLLASLICVDRALAEKRVALVIGNSAYQNAPPLRTPVEDAKAMAAAFQKEGYLVTTQYNGSNLELKRVIRQFEDAAANADTAIIYYAGHGIEIHGENYLIPVDAKLASDRDAADEAIALDRLVESSAGAKQLRVLLLDACRDNPFVRTMKRVGTTPRQGVKPGLAAVNIGSGNILIAFPAKGGATAEDGNGDHTPYTTALLNNLFVPGLDIRLAFGRVRDEVLKLTKNRQEPYVYGSLRGGSSTVVTPAIEAGVEADFKLVDTIGTIGAWEVFLSQHPIGPYAHLARQKLEQLRAARDGKMPSPAQPAPSAAAERPKPVAPTVAALPTQPPPSTPSPAQPVPSEGSESPPSAAPERPAVAAVSTQPPPSTTAESSPSAAPISEVKQPPPSTDPALDSRRAIPPNTLLWWWPHWHR
jgi:caspase domain-containing protein